MRAALKKILDNFLHPFGLNIERYFGKELSLCRLVKIASELNIDLILDVGANTGQFARKIIKQGYNGNIISFEPLSSAYPILLKNAETSSQWQVFERCAIGDTDGKIEINISMNSYSSSILEVRHEHLKAAPSAAIIGKETVSIKKLDTIANAFDSHKNILLKVDTQGFEKNVLDGASELVQNKIKLLQLEMSLLPLYESILPFDKMLSYLEAKGFKPLFFSTGYIDRITDELQQVEGYFIKSDY